MTDNPQHFAQFEPDTLPVLLAEHSPRGWRGLTADGEVLDVNVEHKNGAPVPLPPLLRVSNRSGRTIAYYELPKKETGLGRINSYERHVGTALEHMRDAEPSLALREINAAISIAATTRARFNRALILLQLGRWLEGFAEYEQIEDRSIYMRKQFRRCVEADLRRWRGEDIGGKRLLLIHDHGFGDSIMCLRYVPQLKVMGADVALMLPPELERLGAQLAPVTQEPVHADYFCSLLFLLQVLRQTPENVPTAPYLKVYQPLVEKWRDRLGSATRSRIGIAWSVGNSHAGDYPRPVPLITVTQALARGADLISVQQQGRAEADLLGVANYPFEDFADCAALMSLMDEIVTVDSAAVHLAGAIGHPRITALLSYWSSWRWLSPLYDDVTFCRQGKPGDWESAFAARARARA